MHVKRLERRADKDEVGRSVGLISFLVAAALVAFLWTKSAQDTGPTSPAAQQAEQQALQEASSINFQQAVPTVEAWFTEHDTYAGSSIAYSSPGDVGLELEFDRFLSSGDAKLVAIRLQKHGRRWSVVSPLPAVGCVSGSRVRER